MAMNSVEIDAGSKEIFSLVFLDDNKHLLSGGGEGTIRQWHVDDGKEVGDALKASTRILALAASSDGNWIVSGEDAGFSVWSRYTHRQLLSVTMHEGLSTWLTAVDVSPDSTKFATGGGRDNQVFIWDILNGKRLLGPLQHANVLTTVKFSPDGDRIATGVWWHSIRIYDAHAGDLLKVVPQNEIEFASGIQTPIAWSADGQHIFTVFRNKMKRIDVSDDSDRLSEWTIRGNGSGNRTVSMALSSNGKFIAAFVDPIVSFWDTVTHEEIGHHLEHTSRGSLRSIALSYDSNYLAIGDDGGKIFLYRLSGILPETYLVNERVVPQNRKDKLIQDLEKEKLDLVRQIQSLRGENLSELDRLQAEKHELEEQIETLRLQLSGQTLRLKRLQDEKAEHQSKSDRLEKEQADLKNHIDWLQGKLDECRLQLDRTQKEKGDLKQQVESLRSDLSAQKLRSDELQDEIMRLRDPLEVLRIHVGRGWVRSLVFLEDGDHLLSGSEEGIREWRIDDGTEIGQGLKGSSAVEAIALSRDGKWMVSGEYKVATVWNRHTRRSAFTVKGHSTWVTTVDVSPDSTRFATGSSDKKVFIWDISTGARLVGPLEHDNYVVSVRFSPDGHRIATATWQRESLRIYNGLDGQLLHDVPVSVNSFPSTGIAWTNDSRRIFALSSNIIKHIDASTGAFLPGWTVPGETVGLYGSIALSTNDRFIACFTGRSVSLWDTATRTQIGRPFEQASVLRSIALSLNHDYLATGDENGQIALRNLNNHLPKSYLTDKNATDVEQ